MMNNDNKHKRPNDTDSDLKLRFYLEQCLPQDIGTDDIKLMTHRKIAARRWRTRLLMGAVAAVAACLIIVAGMTWPRPADNSTVLATHTKRIEQHSAPAQKYAIFSVPTGEIKTLLLADGTKIIANSRTVIRYPQGKGPNCREAYVEGEAYFDVAHDSKHPFTVHGNGFTLTVLGTKFNVNSYKGRTADVALVEGSVELRTRNKDAIRMKPNDMVSIKGGSVSEMRRGEAADAALWTSGFIQMDGQSLGHVLAKLEDHYGISIICAPQLEQLKLYGKLSLSGDSQDALQAITFLSDTHYSMKGSKVDIYK